MSERQFAKLLNTWRGAALAHWVQAVPKATITTADGYTGALADYPRLGEFDATMICGTDGTWLFRVQTYYGEYIGTIDTHGKQPRMR